MSEVRVIYDVVGNRMCPIVRNTYVSDNSDALKKSFITDSAIPAKQKSV
jgi:hypothetical protein